MKFDIYYSKRILDQLTVINDNDKFSDAYKKFEKNMETNPFAIEYEELDLPDNKLSSTVETHGQFHYIKLIENIKILYHISEMDSTVEIWMIDIDQQGRNEQ